MATLPALAYSAQTWALTKTQTRLQKNTKGNGKTDMWNRENRQNYKLRNKKKNRREGCG